MRASGVKSRALGLAVQGWVDGVWNGQKITTLILYTRPSKKSPFVEPFAPLPGPRLSCFVIGFLVPLARRPALRRPSVLCMAYTRPPAVCTAITRLSPVPSTCVASAHRGPVIALPNFRLYSAVGCGPPCPISKASPHGWHLMFGTVCFAGVPRRGRTFFACERDENTVRRPVAALNILSSTLPLPGHALRQDCCGNGRVQKENGKSLQGHITQSAPTATLSTHT